MMFRMLACSKSNKPGIDGDMVDMLATLAPPDAPNLE